MPLFKNLIRHVLISNLGNLAILAIYRLFTITYLDSRPTTDGLELDWNKQITSGAKYFDKSTLSMHFIIRFLSLSLGLILDSFKNGIHAVAFQT